MKMIMSHSDTIRSRIGLFLPVLSEAFRRLSAEPFSEADFGQYLVLLHGFVRASVPLMEDAACILELSPDHNPFKSELLAYLREHIEEERGHDQWLIEDLEGFGVDQSSVVGEMPSVHVAAMVGCQYYWIRHYSPIMVLGYIMVLECAPPTEETIENLGMKTGLPRSAFRTLAKHASLDPRHIDDLGALLDRLPLSVDDIDNICVSACTTVSHVIAAFDQLASNQIHESSSNIQGAQ